MKEGVEILNTHANETKDRLKGLLKPCPFCGGKADIDHHIDSFHDIQYHIKCTGCGLSFNNSWGTYQTSDIQKEVVRWNTRANP